MHVQPSLQAVINFETVLSLTWRRNVFSHFLLYKHTRLQCILVLLHIFVYTAYTSGDVSCYFWTTLFLHVLFFSSPSNITSLIYCQVIYSDPLDALEKATDTRIYNSPEFGEEEEGEQEQKRELSAPRGKGRGKVNKSKPERGNENEEEQGSEKTDVERGIEKVGGTETKKNEEI